MNIEKVSLDQLQTNNENIKKQVGYRPTFSCIVCLLFALILFIVAIVYKVFNAGLILLILCFIIYPIFVYLTVKERRTVTFYEPFMLLHDMDDDNLVVKVNYEDIKEWDTLKGATLRLLLSDNQEMYKDTMQSASVNSYLKKILPSKETLEVKRLENRKTKLKFKLPKFK